MEKSPTNRGQALELPISLLVLLVLISYTFGLFAVAPYSGFYFNPVNGHVDGVFVESGQDSLQEGDYIKQIDGITLEKFKEDRNLVLFKSARKGDVIDIVRERGGESRAIQWTFPGFNNGEFFARFGNLWFLTYAFWLAGFAAQTSIRPRDTRRSLFIAANYLTALFLVFGSLSSWHLWGSSALLHATTWIMAPVYLRLHWLFPRPLAKVPNSLWNALYAAAAALALAELLHLLHRSLYQLAFLIALFGSILLLIAHFVLRKNERRVIFLLLLSLLIAFSLSITFAIALTQNLVLDLGPFTFFSMPFMPLAYFFLIYRRQLGGMETRVNRIVSLYAFLILLGVVLFLLVIPFMNSPLSPAASGFLTAGVSFAACLATAIFLPRFQAFVDQRFLGIKLPYQHLPEIYSNRIAASTSLPSLLALLEDEVFPSLLIRQYAFLRANEKNLILLLARDIPDTSFDFDALTQKAGAYIPNPPPHEDWLRLILPLKVGGITLGFWLLGRRDPDDLYPQVEIPILQSLADQTAIALSNLIHEENLRGLYQTDIERSENERKSLARDLHDIVLNQLAAMRLRLDDSALPPGFIEEYEQVSRRLREIINDLRPPILDQGLSFALNGLADDIREKNGNLRVVMNVQAGDERIPENVETYIYFIVREACENVLRHARAKTLTISGEISPRRVELTIQDDGGGFPFGNNPDLKTLLAGRHFGLAGMMERATQIGAKMDLRSRKEGGVVIEILWKQP